jgi:hypothetical protein
MIDSSKRVGTISTITSHTITAQLIDDPPDITGLRKSDQMCRVGNFVIIPVGERSVIGTIASSRILDATEGERVAAKSPKRTADMQLIGTLTNGKFTRGVAAFPVIGSLVYAAGPEDLKTVFSTFREC